MRLIINTYLRMPFLTALFVQRANTIVYPSNVIGNSRKLETNNFTLKIKTNNLVPLDNSFEYKRRYTFYLPKKYQNTFFSLKNCNSFF